jgi:hypothetical protein
LHVPCGVLALFVVIGVLIRIGSQLWHT